MNYKHKYAKHFGLCEHDTLFDEYEYVVSGRHVKALNYYLLEGSRIADHSTLVALSSKNYQCIIDGRLFGRDLKELHYRFLKNNPYGE